MNLTLVSTQYTKKYVNALLLTLFEGNFLTHSSKLNLERCYSRHTVPAVLERDNEPIWIRFALCKGFQRADCFYIRENQGPPRPCKNIPGLSGSRFNNVKRLIRNNFQIFVIKFIIDVMCKVKNVVRCIWLVFETNYEFFLQKRCSKQRLRTEKSFLFETKYFFLHLPGTNRPHVSVSGSIAHGKVYAHIRRTKKMAFLNERWPSIGRAITLYLSYPITAFVMPPPIPDKDPTNAKTWHQNFPNANPRWKELYMKIGVLHIIIKSHIAKFRTKIFDGVRRDLALFIN